MTPGYGNKVMTPIHEKEPINPYKKEEYIKKKDLLD